MSVRTDNMRPIVSDYNGFLSYCSLSYLIFVHYCKLSPDRFVGLIVLRIKVSTTCLKNVCWVFFYNSKQLEPIIVFFWNTISWKSSILNTCIISHLTLAAFLHYPRIHQEPNRHVVFLWVCSAENEAAIWRPTTPIVFLENSHTDWRTFLSEHFTNKSFSAVRTVRGLPFPGRLSTVNLSCLGVLSSFWRLRRSNS